MRQFIVIITLCILIIGLHIQVVNAQQYDKSSSKQNIIAPGTGIKTIEIGKSTAQDVATTYGENYKLEENNGYSNQLTYADLGLSFYYCAKDQEKKIFLIELLKGSTDKKITVGKSTLKDVLKIYGEPVEIGADFESFIFKYKGVQFYFRVCLNFQEASCLSIIRIIASWINAFETSVLSS